ncbi:MAG: alpha/beta hydrolase [Candidatus Nanopelagicales bacterium]|nr:alpha/beta hydrolase [Candidatus Nanopelagicales bacterium]MCU0297373.1 alpha/beta hydrolase [Candidatus Nanopelagicales bacterium]
MTDTFQISPAARGLRRMLALPPRWIERLAGPAPQLDGRTLDPAVHLLVRANERLQATGKDGDLQHRRDGIRRSSRLIMPTLQGISVTNRTLPGPDGAIPVRVYRSHRSVGPLPVIVYFHGGGWVVGDLDSHDGSCRMLAGHSGAAVVSVDYRLAPEFPFPGPLDDAWAAFRYVFDHPGEFGGVPGLVAVMGDSAGANLAAAVCLRGRDDGPLPRAQILIYPATDLRMEQPSIDTFADGFLLTKADMIWYREQYLTDPAQMSDPLVSPLLAPDVSGLPPTQVWTAGFDPLRDEGARYAQRLQDAGVACRYTCLDDQVHGFFSMGVLPGGMTRVADICRSAGELVRSTHGTTRISSG